MSKSYSFFVFCSSVFHAVGLGDIKAVSKGVLCIGTLFHDIGHYAQNGGEGTKFPSVFAVAQSALAGLWGQGVVFHHGDQFFRSAKAAFLCFSAAFAVFCRSLCSLYRKVGKKSRDFAIFPCFSCIFHTSGEQALTIGLFYAKLNPYERAGFAGSAVLASIFALWRERSCKKCNRNFP